MTVKNILISQQPPKAASPYSAITEKYGVNFDFVPFFTIEPLSSREFRAQRVNILDHSAIVFSARSTIDAFFRLCEELRVKIPETMKYFCTTEAVAMYLQKHIVYRKRKIFFGDGTASSVISQIGGKHKDETFLIATSDLAGNDITKAFQESGLKYESAIFVKSVSQDLKGTDLSSYDMIVLYNPSDVKSIYENYPDFKPGSTRFVAYGKSVLKAMDEAGLEVAVSAPTPEAPSVAKALELYLRLHGRKDISRLIAEGKFGGVQGLRCCVRPDNGLAYSRIMVSVPKKLFKRAVKRNLLKRRLRESYRLQKHLLKEGAGADIMLIYSSREVLTFSQIYSLVGQILEKIARAQQDKIQGTDERPC